MNRQFQEVGPFQFTLCMGQNGQADVELSRQEEESLLAVEL